MSKDLADPDHSRLAVRFQDQLPAEIWSIIVCQLDLVDIFSLYNTSVFMRSLVVPTLVRAMATKTARLFLYQEYVRRVCVRFEFDHFDLARDRVVFRPIAQDHQFRFRCGLTLQSPQLEEIGVRSTSRKIGADQVVCSEDGRIYTVTNNLLSRTQAGSTNLPMDVSVAAANDFEAGISHTWMSPVSPMQDSTPDTGTLEIVPNDTNAVGTMSELPVSAEAVAQASTRKRTRDEKAYQGTRNFLDKTCPLNIRKNGLRKVDGAKYSFMPGYPWTLHYQVENEQLGPGVPTVSRSIFKSENRNQRGQPDQSQLGMFVRATNTDNLHHPSSSGPTLPTEPPGPSGQASEMTRVDAYNQVKSTTIITAEKGSTKSSKNTGGNGPRYLRGLLFECSMNFLDPKRATRNIIGRWLEGKVQHWKRILVRKGLHPTNHAVSTIPLLTGSHGIPVTTNRSVFSADDHGSSRDYSRGRNNYRPGHPGAALQGESTLSTAAVY
ncbi:hypothetical protein BGW38_010183 [Lunasporangiospora selenospora]|uniref:F-box domain-containing protein n=1 Tax=Lunasporangiospora selenospora TaxID=979761 RepID=A0A9P6KFM0_9FUNG|nr:hypothetical protein BGW38_010183 [Lunasporangiospora selenospora]